MSVNTTTRERPNVKKDRRLALSARRRIRDRLQKKISESHYRTRFQLEKTLGLTHSAVAGWLNSDDPNTPDTVSLYRLSEALGFSIDWLLFDVGPDQRGAVRTTGKFAEDLRAQLIAYLRQRVAYSEEELNRFLPMNSVDQIWASIVRLFGRLLLEQERDEYDRGKSGAYFKWLLERSLTKKNRHIQPFYEVERSYPL
jgi:transcriptional regulator with XRE-family HTH domain